MPFNGIPQNRGNDFRHRRIFLQGLMRAREIQCFLLKRRSLWRATGRHARAGRGGFDGGLIFRKRAPNLTREILICLNHAVKVLFRDKKDFIRDADFAGDELERVERLDIVGVGDADLESAVHLVERHESVMSGGINRDVTEHLFVRGRIAEHARRETVCFPDLGKLVGK